MIIMVILIAWAVKFNKYGLLRGTPQYTTALIVISFGISIFLFAYSRKRLLRNLRVRVLFNTSQFLESSQAFDMALTKCLSTIREAELLSRGYRPDLVDNDLDGLGLAVPEAPAGRIENSASNDGVIMGKHLRSSVSAGLYLCTSTCLNAIQEILPFCNESDLEKYLNIYEIDLTDLEEFGWATVSNSASDGFYDYIQRSLNVPREDFYGANGATAPLQKIKMDLFKLHFLRRLLICCLLSIPTTGKYSAKEVESWHTVELHLEQISNLMQQLSKTLTPNRIISSIGASDKQPPSKEIVLSESWQKQVRSLNHISSTLQHIEARMEMLRDSSLSMINSSNACEKQFSENDEEIYGSLLDEKDLRVVEDDFERTFELIGDDIKSLLSLWETGKKNLSQGIRMRRANSSVYDGAPESVNNDDDFYDQDQNTMMSLSPTSNGRASGLSITSTLASGKGSNSSRAGVTIGKDLNFLIHHRRQSSEFSSFSGATVLEGMSEQGGLRRKQLLSTMSRQERVKKMQEERTIEEQRRSVLMQRNNFVEELGSVLDYRRRAPREK